VTPERRRILGARAAWRLTARPNQLTPDGDWFAWLLLAGRGFGKTRTGAEDQAKYAIEHPGARIAVVAPTYADARDTCVEGDSGLEQILTRYGVLEQWNRSLGELTLTNGSRFKLFSAEEPDRLRGPQHHRAWCEELAAWERPETWDQLLFGLRLGVHPQVVITTTPRPTPLIRGLLARDDVTVTRGSTFDNAAHLAPSALAQLKDRYEGTRLGRQELFAEILDDVEGALWTSRQLEQLRVPAAPELTRVVVAVDPAVTADTDSDETGIVVAGLGVDGHVYVLGDRSTRDSPQRWMARALAAYDEHGADRLVAETNNGGDLIEAMVRSQAGARVAYRKVTASRGKRTRAEPVAALYEQGRVHHLGGLPQLEDQMCSWTPDSGASPDRLDALVWAVTDLALGKRKGFAAVA
jgi:predicted phage terminase large subunit-like protein